MGATSLQYQPNTLGLFYGTYSTAAYLEIEAASGERHEFYNGEIIRMAGGSINHNRIAKNVLQYLGNELDKKTGFELFGSDQKIYLPKFNYYVYPDAVVIAEAPLVTEKEAGGIINPVLIVEVLSPSTAAYDRNQKFVEYRSLESFVEYILVRQDLPEVLSFFRSEPHHWEETLFEGLEKSLYCQSIDVYLPLELIYKNVELKR
jgi:Uma2 family endonuclease